MQSHDASQKKSALMQTAFRRLISLQAIPGLQVSWCKLEVELTTPKSVLMASADGQPQDVPPLVVAALNLKTRFDAQVLCLLSSYAATPLICQHNQQGCLGTALLQAAVALVTRAAAHDAVSDCHQTCCTEDTSLASPGSACTSYCDTPCKRYMWIRESA